MTNLETLKEYLPLLIPLIVAELALFVWALVHVLTHKNYKHGNRVLWLMVGHPAIVVTEQPGK